MTFTQIIEGAKFRADLKNTERVTLSDWITLTNESIASAWTLAAAARPDFQSTSRDFVVTSGGSAAIALPSNFHNLIDVVFSPDTASEYSLGPFAWADRRAPGNWAPWIATGAAPGGSSARLMGGSIYIEPATRAGGTYRVWYAPKPKTINLTVRLATTGSGLPAYTASGSGVGKQLVGNASAALTVDGVAVSGLNGGDRILVKNGNTAVDNGIYFVSAAGSGLFPWVLVRATDYDQDTEVTLGDAAFVAEGTVNAGTIQELATFAGIVDTSPQVWLSSGGPLDSILDQFSELLRIGAAIPAMLRDDDLDTRPLDARRMKLEKDLQTYFRQVRPTNGPAKIIDTDALRNWGGGW